MKIYEIKFISFIILCCITGISVTAQDEGNGEIEQSTDTGFFAFGGVGPAIPLGGFGNERASGFDFNTAISYRFPSHFILRGMFDFSSFTFERGAITQIVGAETYELSGSNNLISLNVSGGYYFPAGRFSPYIFAGAGISFISKPEVEIDENLNLIDLTLSLGTYFSTVSGIGVDFLLNPQIETDVKEKTPFILYTEAFYTYVPSITEVSRHKFQLLTFNVGIKTKM